MSFELRGLEIHSSRMWRWQSIERVFDVMQKVNLNALIFHQNDLIDQLVFPRKYFSEELMWKRWPVRMHTLDQNKQYIRKVIREAKELDINFFAEVKEICYPEGLLEFFPHLIKTDGAICVTDPFWWEFLNAKVKELLEVVPEIAGVIVSTATRESKVSISTNSCTCERCQHYDTDDWYYNLIKAMYTPLAEKGKALVVRDFSYTAEQQNKTIDAASKCSKDIIIALKNTPHDFYPTFPNNPRIGKGAGHHQWVEFDTWGQFFGLGFFPCSVIEDMQMRFRYCQENDVSGIWLRTDWEVMTEASAFNSFNLLNVFGGGMLSTNIEENLDEVYRRWFEYGLFSPLKPESCQTHPLRLSEAALPSFKHFMKASWDIIEKTLFVRGHVIHEDGMFPNSLQRAFDMMTVIHGRDEWEPGASKKIEATDENLQMTFTEKQEALEEVKKLPGILKLDQYDRRSELHKELSLLCELYQLYVEGFYYCTQACFLARKTIPTQKTEDKKNTEHALGQLSSYRERMIQRLKNTKYPHYVYWLFDDERLQALIDDINERIQ